jgi:hypothetical protein
MRKVVIFSIFWIEFIGKREGSERKSQNIQRVSVFEMCSLVDKSRMVKKLCREI